MNMVREKKSALYKLIMLIAVQLIFFIAITWFFDPFYQYHEPYAGLKAVLNDHDNQMPGSISTLPYDSVLVGSSVAENFDSSVLDRNYHCNTLKIIKGSGSVADLLYYLERAHGAQELKNVFWCLDLFALEASNEVSLYGKEIPRYLHTESVLDDVTYLLNKDVIFNKIPLMVASSLQEYNTGGNAYNWSKGKVFSAQVAMQAYQKPKEPLKAQDFTNLKSVIDKNVQMVVEEVSAHPEIQYRFLMPPYSMMWWDCAYVNGVLEKNFYILEKVIPALLECSNVELYYYQDEAQIICNLDNYMDLIHYTPAVNQYMLDQLIAGEGRVTKENWQMVVSGMRELADRISREEIYRYYERP